MVNQAWSHLPNAVLIDRVIADIGANTETWVAAQLAGFDVRGAAKDAAKDAAWAAAWDAAREAAKDAAWAAADAVLALVAWDDCGHLLDTDPEQVRVLALLGQPAAVLLYPACVVLYQQKELA
jgi:hypothetical protein